MWINNSYVEIIPKFSATNYSSQYSRMISFSSNPTFEKDSINIYLTEDDTKDCYGKYIYQIEFLCGDGGHKIWQGTIVVYRNINYAADNLEEPIISSVGDTIVAYIVNDDDDHMYTSTWLSDEPDGSPINPSTDYIYYIEDNGYYYWDTANSRYSIISSEE